MTCFHPLDVWRSLTRLTERGKGVITFAPPAGPAEPMKINCGQCIGCRLDRSREWALRCIHEASLHDDNCFITLTYNDESVPPGGTLCKRDHQKFIKRLRKKFPVKKISYFLCGEYGEETHRPHYHALLFNHDFWDKLFWTKSGDHDVYISPDLQQLWPHGHSWIGSVTWQSAAYVARYILKKVNGDLAADKYINNVNPETGECNILEPEYIAMSKRPPIGKRWVEKYSSDCRKDFLTAEGKKYKVPKLYDSVLEVEDAQHYLATKQKRREAAESNKVTRKRLSALERAQQLKAKQLKRSL